MASSPRLEFWYDFASTYSYLSVLRIGELCEGAGVALIWRPFLLGPIFAAQGWDTSPFNLYPAKGRYMVRDMERMAAAMGAPFKLPEPFPQHSLLAARVALLGEDEGWEGAFTRATFAAQFGAGAAISDPATIAGVLEGLGVPADETLARAGARENKERLRARTEEAAARGLFGAPSFVTGRGELFWGNDRLEQAIAWAVKEG